MNSNDLIHQLREQISIEATERVIEHLGDRLDELIENKVEVSKKYLSIAEACKYLGVSRSMFYTLIRKYKPLKVRIGNSPRYSISDLDKMFEFQ